MGAPGPRSWAACLAALVAVAGCGGAEPPAGPRPRALSRQTIASAVDGLSGLAIDGRGVPIAVAERGTALVALEASPRTIALEGVPSGLDTESIAWLGGARFALGTESMDTRRDGDPIFVVEVEGARARVVDRIELPYAVLGVTAEENRGIEGLCFVPGPDVLVAAMENVVVERGARHAPLGVRRGGGAWARALVALSSETGKLSALSCRANDAAIEVFAIERHYGVMRVLSFELPSTPDARVTPRVALDLAGLLDGDPNLEGLALEGETLLLVTDNHHGRRTGPSELVRARLP
ncbi:MAG: esterase-like activity of phytase family protein [Sandaracinaceae bacterium]|nr:esterase-like activity of phytase family protein [Sandaracinaceae bacterium]